MSFLYFAYGSNLLRERILMNNPSAVFVTCAKLSNYRLRFCVRGSWQTQRLRWRGGAATIEESEGDSVWGVVWKLEKSDLASLDHQEGVGEGVYRRLDSLRVTTSDQSPLDCITYQFLEPVFTRPSPHYLKVLQTGAVQHGLPEEYRRVLDSIEHNGYDGPLPLFDEIMNKVKL